jgi:hypothetical protein
MQGTLRVNLACGLKPFKFINKPTKSDLLKAFI